MWNLLRISLSWNSGFAPQIKTLQRPQHQASWWRKLSSWFWIVQVFCSSSRIWVFWWNLPKIALFTLCNILPQRLVFFTFNYHLIFSREITKLLRWIRPIYQRFVTPSSLTYLPPSLAKLIWTSLRLAFPPPYLIWISLETELAPLSRAPSNPWSTRWPPNNLSWKTN